MTFINIIAHQLPSHSTSVNEKKITVFGKITLLAIKIVLTLSGYKMADESRRESVSIMLYEFQDVIASTQPENRPDVFFGLMVSAVSLAFHFGFLGRSIAFLLAAFHALTGNTRCACGRDTDNTGDYTAREL